MDHDNHVGGSGQLRAEGEATAPSATPDIATPDIADVIAMSPNADRSAEPIVLALCIIAREMRMTRLALDHRNRLLEESNAMAREGRKPTTIDMRVDVRTDGQDGTRLAKDFADAIGAEFDRVFRGGS